MSHAEIYGKSIGFTQIYELDEVSGILHYTVRDGRKVLTWHEIKLHNIDAEYNEYVNLRELPFWRSVKPPSFSKSLASLVT